MPLSPCAGKPAEPSLLVDVPRLVTAYYTAVPDASVPEQRVAFGTSGHRGSAFENSFNEWHVLAISQAICDYRKRQNIDGPLFLGIDTHALSVPAHASALEVLAANGVEVMLAQGDEYTPTPAVSHAILTYNRRRKTGRADGIVITPSHNPPHDGGFKYNPSNGGPADTDVTGWIEARANVLLGSGLRGVHRISFEQALRAATTHRHDYLDAYTSDLATVLDGSLGFGGEESAGAAFVRLDGSVWTTDKDGIVPALLAAEMTARMGRDPGEIYRELVREVGEPVYDRVEAPATPEQKERLERFSPRQILSAELAGEKIQTILTHAPGNGAPIGGLKVIAESGWFAARPSGTEDIYKIYAESFRGAAHLRRILVEAQTIVSDALAASPQQSRILPKKNSQEGL